MREVWDEEERIVSIRGTLTNRMTVVTGGVTNTRTPISNSDFALEPGKRFWYLVNDGGANGYTITATRERVTRKFPQIIEDFPVSVWETKPIPLAVDVFSSKMQIERLLQPLHGYLGLTSDEKHLAGFAGGTVTRVGENYIVNAPDDDEDFSLSFTIARSPAPHLVQIEMRGLLGGMSYLFEGRIADESSNIWVTTRSDFVSGSFHEANSIAVDWESINQSLPDELFVINDAGMGKVNYNRFLPRFEHWVSDGVFDNPAYSYMRFRELFPGLFMILIAMTIVLAIGALAILVVVSRRCWRAAVGEKGEV